MPIPSSEPISIDVDKAEAIWSAYAATHDLTGQKGRAAGIDPVSGKIWLGKDALDIVNQMEAKDEFRPLYFVRIGYPTYLRKGGRR